jgi:hypothetical protein
MPQQNAIEWLIFIIWLFDVHFEAKQTKKTLLHINS